MKNTITTEIGRAAKTGRTAKTATAVAMARTLLPAPEGFRTCLFVHTFDNGSLFGIPVDAVLCPVYAKRQRGGGGRLDSHVKFNRCRLAVLTATDAALCRDEAEYLSVRGSMQLLQTDLHQVKAADHARSNDQLALWGDWLYDARFLRQVLDNGWLPGPPGNPAHNRDPVSSSAAAR